MWSRPAPAICAICLIHGVASAQSGGTAALDSLYACAAKADAAERLACFDAAVAALRAAEAMGKVQVVDTEVIASLEKDAFGLRLPSLPAIYNARLGIPGTQREEIAQIEAGISAIRKGKISGRLTVWLDNGQVWEQIDTVRLTPARIRKARTASVRRAALGSFQMSIDGGTPIRVRRIE